MSTIWKKTKENVTNRTSNAFDVNNGKLISLVRQVFFFIFTSAKPFFILNHWISSIYSLIKRDIFTGCFFFILSKYPNCYFQCVTPCIACCAKFDWNWPCGSGKDENVKSVQTDGQVLGKKIFKSFKIIFTIYQLSSLLVLRNSNVLYPRILCAKFGWNWPNGSGEGDEKD